MSQMKATPDKEQFPWLLVLVAALVLIFVLLMTENAKSQELETHSAIHAAHQSRARR